jgi:peptidoglycan hydrolase-like protein with peptidoglycan-binding domain
MLEFAILIMAVNLKLKDKKLKIMLKTFGYLRNFFRLITLTGAMFFVLAFPVNAHINDDLVGYWTFNQNAGDYSPYKTPTTIDWSAGVPTSVGSCMVSGCYEFCTAGGACAGGSIYTNNTVPDLAGSSFTIAGWVLNRAANSSGWPILYRWAGDHYVGINTTGNNLIASYKPNDGVSLTLSSAVPMVIDTWYHVAVVVNTANNHIYFYVNGNLVDDAVISDSVVVGAVEALYFGEDPGYSTMSGQVDEVMIWKRAVTQAEVDYLYNDGLGRDLSVVNDRFEWNFEDAYKRSLIVTPNPLIYGPDYGEGSLGMYGTEIFTAWNVGYSGGFAPNSNTWTGGMDTNYWRVRLQTFGLENLRVSSRQRSSNTGPRDFKLQYSVSGRLPLVWVDVPGGTITNADNFTSGVLTNLALPEECENSYVLYLRWIMTSNINVTGGAVANAGTSRIDNIIIEGDIINYTLDYAAGAGGSLTGDVAQTVSHGLDGTAVTAVPNVGYHFVDWSDASTDNPRTDTSVVENINVTANFAIDNYTLTYNTDGNGTISGTAVQTVDHGFDGTAVTAVPNSGYLFNEWSDGIKTATRTDSNIINNLTVTARFRKPGTVALQIPGGVGTGTVDQSIAMYETKVVGKLDQGGINILAYLNGQANFEAKESQSGQWAWHHIKILNVDMVSQKVTIEVFSEPQTFVMGLEEEIKVDLDADQIKDISIKFEDLFINRVELTVKSLLNDSLLPVVETPVLIVETPVVSTCPANFTRDLKQNMTGADVKALQQYLNQQGFSVASVGVGSVGNETEYFGALTKSALVRFQKAKGIAATFGEFDLATRVFLGCASAPVAGEQTVTGKHRYNRNLDLGMSGADVKELQKFLNTRGFVLATEGPGSPGNETETFGSLTKHALARYQASQGIVPANGDFSDWTRWWLNKQ